MRLIEVEYEDLPAVFDPLEAMKPEAPILHPDYPTYKGPKTMALELKNVQTLVRARKGDVEKAFAEADYVFEKTYRTQLVHQGYIEPYACTVEVDREGRVGIWVALPDGSEAKIGAVGVRVRRWVSYHGVAINLCPDLAHFQGIVPCGISEHGVTSLKALGVAASLAELDEALRASFADVFEKD
jgi:hypothetical protein